MKKLFMAAVFAGLFTGVNAQVKVGAMAPEISLPDLKDSLVNLSSLKGKIVLIDFWASWCGPCRQSNPEIVRLFKKYQSIGFVVLGVSIDQKKADWQKAVHNDHISYLQVNDAAGWNSPVADKYGINQIPTSFLLDKTGKVVAIDLEGSQLENKIKSLL